MKDEIREIGSIDEEIAAFEEWALLAEHIPTKKLLDGIKEEIAALKAVPFRVGDTAAEGELAMILETCGLGFPKDAREQFDCFLAIKTVVHWVERKLKQIEDNARWYYELMEQKRKEEGANG